MRPTFSCASDSAIPSPITRIGRWLRERISAASSMAAGSGRTRQRVKLVGWMETSASWSYAAAAYDLRQPSSGNYGLPPAARLSGPPTRMSSAEAEALITRAIAEHEMRRP